MAEALLRAGASVEAAKPGDLSCPLHRAANFGHAAVVAVLARHARRQLDGAAYTAFVDARARGQWTALLLACIGGHAAAVAALLEHGASLAPLGPTAATPLLAALQAGQLDIAAQLIATAGLSAAAQPHRALAGGFSFAEHLDWLGYSAERIHGEDLRRGTRPLLTQLRALPPPYAVVAASSIRCTPLGTNSLRVVWRRDEEEEERRGEGNDAFLHELHVSRMGAWSPIFTVTTFAAEAPVEDLQPDTAYEFATRHRTCSVPPSRAGTQGRGCGWSELTRTRPTGGASMCRTLALPPGGVELLPPAASPTDTAIFVRLQGRSQRDLQCVSQTSAYSCGESACVRAPPRRGPSSPGSTICMCVFGSMVLDVMALPPQVHASPLSSTEARMVVREGIFCMSMAILRAICLGANRLAGNLDAMYLVRVQRDGGSILSSCVSSIVHKTGQTCVCQVLQPYGSDYATVRVHVSLFRVLCFIAQPPSPLSPLKSSWERGKALVTLDFPLLLPVWT